MDRAPFVDIIANGWPLPGRHNTLHGLIDLIGKHKLQVDCNEIRDEGHGEWRFSGNFSTVSHVFNVRTNDPELIQRLCIAITLNRLRPDYLEDCAYRHAAYEETIEALKGQPENIERERASWETRGPRVAGRIEDAAGGRLLPVEQLMSDLQSHIAAAGRASPQVQSEFLALLAAQKEARAAELRVAPPQDWSEQRVEAVSKALMANAAELRRRCSAVASGQMEAAQAAQDLLPEDPDPSGEDAERPRER